MRQLVSVVNRFTETHCSYFIGRPRKTKGTKILNLSTVSEH